MFSTSSMSSRVGIFWDYSSCHSKYSKDICSIATSLREEFIKYGKVTFFKAYFGLPGSTPYEQPSTSIRSEIEEIGVTTVDNPKAGFGALATDVLSFLLDRQDFRAYTTVVFVSENPDIGYLMSALRARGIKVGLIISSGKSNNLSSQASWTRDWDSYTSASGRPSLFGRRNDSTWSNLRSWPAPAPSVGSDSDYSLLYGSSPTFDSGKDTASDPSNVGAKLETTQTPQAPLSVNVDSSQFQPACEFAVPAKKIQQPLRPPRRLLQSYFTKPTPSMIPSHELRMFEDDPHYVELIKDPEAMKIKAWRRELKRLFFVQDINANPNIQSDLDAIFTSLEQYDKMTKNYLAFTRICKLLTQISQVFIDTYDYRQPCVVRAKRLLAKWESLARSSDDLKV